MVAASGCRLMLHIYAVATTFVHFYRLQDTQMQVYFKKLYCKKSGGVFVKLVDCGGYLVNCRAEICPQVQVYFKKLNCKKSGGIFVKLVDCGGYLVNLASTEYRSITEKFKGFLIKLMDFRIILTKSRVFLQNSRSTARLLKVQGFF